MVLVCACLSFIAAYDLNEQLFPIIDPHVMMHANFEP